MDEPRRSRKHTQTIGVHVPLTTYHYHLSFLAASSNAASSVGTGLFSGALVITRSRARHTRPAVRRDLSGGA